jgi:lysine-N-methylase
VPVDPAAVKRYQALPPSPLRTQLDECILTGESNPSQPLPGGFASIRMLPSEECPFLSDERLCRIQQELGERYLCKTCSQYPRHYHSVDRIEECSLSLSCPEAGRLVLLDPALLASSTTRYKARWDKSVSCTHPLRTFFWPIREFVLQLILNRSYALWQRMFLLGIFCQRLDAIARAEDKRTFPEFLRDFSAVVAAGNLRGPMETIPGNAGLQLKLVTELVRLGVSDVARRRPWVEQCLSAFDSGVGHVANASFEEQIASYAAAFARDYEPFMRNHPWILENYLVNELIGWAFPFGPALFQPDGKFDFTALFAQLAIQFGILKGLLIGVAGFHHQAFADAHVVQTVQVVSRQFEHSQQFLHDSYAFLGGQKLADVAGLTTLLRN